MYNCIYNRKKSNSSVDKLLLKHAINNGVLIAKAKSSHYGRSTTVITEHNTTVMTEHNTTVITEKLV